MKLFINKFQLIVHWSNRTLSSCVIVEHVKLMSVTLSSGLTPFATIVIGVNDIMCENYYIRTVYGVKGYGGCSCVVPVIRKSV